MLIAGSIIIMLWGIAHLVPTKNIIKGFGEISEDNKKIITMEWIAEGLTLIFLGLIVFMLKMTGRHDPIICTVIINLAAGMLLVLALLSLFTGAKTKILPMKLCPIVKFIVAILYMWGS